MFRDWVNEEEIAQQKTEDEAKPELSFDHLTFMKEEEKEEAKDFLSE